MNLVNSGLFLFFVLFIIPVISIRCNFGKFLEANNEIAVASVNVKVCGSEYCASNYSNDGQDIHYSLHCGDDTICKYVGCIINISTSSRFCCCVGDLCVHEDAVKPIEYPLEGILMSSATAAYQVEGGADIDGRGPSIWDVWTRRPNVINNNDTGNVACDSYHKWREDIALLKAMNVNQYRFSVSWTRIFTDGTINTVNQKGVDYYSNLIDELIENEIEPVVTMYHWDLPQTIGDTGGWLNPHTVDKFADYARFLFTQYGGRVKKWITINEPLMITELQYCGEYLIHAGGSYIDQCEWSFYAAAINLMRAHLAAWRIYKSLDADLSDGIIGIASGMTHFFPNSTNDNEAAQRASDFKWNLFLHPIFSDSGDWPDSVITRLAELSKREGRSQSRLPEFTEDEINDLRGSAQFIGVNFYRAKMAASIVGKEDQRWHYAQREYDSGTIMFSDETWREINVTNSWIHYTPHGLRALLNQIKTLYGDIPLLITENGVMDTRDENLFDFTRIHYIRGHLMAVSQAKYVDHINVVGYTYWSLLDNFEWEQGYSSKFGLHRVDFNDTDRKRTPKASAHFFANVIKTQKVKGFSINKFW